MSIPPPEEAAKQNKPSKVVPVAAPKVEYDFTCKRCGSHLYTNHACSTAKFAGFSLGFKTVRVCRVCNAAEAINF